MFTIGTIGTQEEPYPILGNVWDFFSEKGTKTVFVSVGTGKTCQPDLDFAETIGCSILKMDVPETSQKWSEIKEILKTRKVAETTSEFAKPAAKKWVLPKNLYLEECLPGLHKGTIVQGDKTIQIRPWMEVLQEHCARIGLKEDQMRIDILKVDSSPFEAEILHSLWQTGFRPSLLLIHWTESPDSNMQVLLSAAHLQMLGYVLIGKEGNRFLYYFTDVNYYETCSWETLAKRFENPLMSNLVKSILPGSPGSGIQFPVDK